MNRDTAKPHVKNRLPGPNAQKWVTFHLKNAAKATYEKHFVWDRAAPATGPFCTDPDGNVFLDFASHVAANPLGYNHPELTALAQKLAKIDPDRYAGTDFIGAFGNDPKSASLPTPSHLHEKILEITSQFGFKKAFFTNSGAEAVENAMKLCYQYRKNFGYGFTFNGAFHGRTLGALSLNRSKKAHRMWYPQIPKIISVPFYSHYSKQNGDTIEAMLDSGTGWIDPSEVAFIIIEPIQGEGGYRIADAKTIQNLASLAKKHDIPLICDEIQSGMGRTGKWWASEHFGIKPDIITAGKALRIGATIGNEKLFPTEEYRIGSTWGEGNAIASAVGYKTIEIIQKENLLKNAEKMGNYFLKELRKIQARFPSLVEDVRGIGLMDAIELRTQEQRNKFQQTALERGIIILGCGEKTIRLLPPLNVTKREIDIGLEIIDGSLKKIKK
ncbi:MAG TPA: aspartate aminotransferase family protein [Candidatus Gracilibacteria bacterium]|nr:aspartate aminotransferase family protein [Candidatus Gracilibacteria bacterium]